MIQPTFEKCSGKPQRVKMPNLTEADKARIVALKVAKWSHKEIALGVGCSVATVSRVLKRWNNCKHKRHFVYKSSGRRSAFTKEIKWAIVRMMEAPGGRLKTPAEIIIELKKTFPDFKTSDRSMRSELVKLGYHGRVCVKKPLLRPINKVRRMEWARQHKNWRLAQWNRVLWSDEKKFELFNQKRRKYCRRKDGEALRDDTIQGTVKHGGGSIMFWGCFGGNQVGLLKKINGIMDKDKYHQILVHQAFPSSAKIFNDGNMWGTLCRSTILNILPTRLKTILKVKRVLLAQKLELWIGPRNPQT